MVTNSYFLEELLTLGPLSPQSVPCVSQKIAPLRDSYTAVNLD